MLMLQVLKRLSLKKKKSNVQRPTLDNTEHSSLSSRFHSLNWTVAGIPFTYAEVWQVFRLVEPTVGDIFLCVVSDFHLRFLKIILSLALTIMTTANIYWMVTMFHKDTLSHLTLNNNPLRSVLWLCLTQFTDEEGSTFFYLFIYLSYYSFQVYKTMY